MIILHLPYPISSNLYWRSFVPKGHKRALVVLSAEARAYKAEVHWIVLVETKLRRPLQGKVALHIVLHPIAPKDAAARARKAPETWTETVRCIDLDNALKVTIDCLKGVVIEDDKWVYRIVAERGEPVERGAVVVTVTPMAPAADLFSYPDFTGKKRVLVGAAGAIGGDPF